MNGATRLQPVILQIGQAAGTLAAISIEKNLKPSRVNIRLLQSSLLKNKVYLMPYLDVDKYDAAFEAIQRIGATGILRGKGVPYKWANQTWFYPDSTITRAELQKGIKLWQPAFQLWNESDLQKVSTDDLAEVIQVLSSSCGIELTSGCMLTRNHSKMVTKKDIAVELDKCIQPFSIKDVDWHGTVIDQ